MTALLYQESLAVTLALDLGQGLLSFTSRTEHSYPDLVHATFFFTIDLTKGQKVAETIKRRFAHGRHLHRIARLNRRDRPGRFRGSCNGRIIDTSRYWGIGRQNIDGAQNGPVAPIARTDRLIDIPEPLR